MQIFTVFASGHLAIWPSGQLGFGFSGERCAGFFVKRCCNVWHAVPKRPAVAIRIKVFQ